MPKLLPELKLEGASSLIQDFIDKHTEIPPRELIELLSAQELIRESILEIKKDEK